VAATHQAPQLLLVGMLALALVQELVQEPASAPLQWLLSWASQTYCHG
jgi:hypothetical protein